MKLFVPLLKLIELKNFNTIFLESADEFIQTLDKKTRKKLFQNIRIAEKTSNPNFFKKLNKDIWEFRVRFSNTQIRLLAFWIGEKMIIPW